MALRGRKVKDIPMAPMGINLNDPIELVQPGEALLTQNMYSRRGLQTKLGSSRHSPNQVVAGKPIVGLHRFYFGASRQLIAAAGTQVFTMNDSTGVWTAMSGITQTDGQPTFINTWGAVGKAYIANGTDVPFSWDGTTATRLTAFPADTIMILPYRSRLLFITKSNPGLVQWTDAAFIDNSVITPAAALIRMTEGGQINVIAPHAMAGTTEGINTWVFVSTGSSIALMYSLDFLATGGLQTATTKLERVSDHVGIIASRTVANTPLGTMFLGTDRQVYLLPFGSARLQPVGTKIRSTGVVTDGIESLPFAQMEKACAVYHDGFYKLSFAASGDTNNTTQYWLDIERIHPSQQNDGRWGPWFGPMKGMNISMFAKQDGTGDVGRLLGGNALSSGFVFRANEPSIFSDDSVAINSIFKSHHEVFGAEVLDKQINQTEIETIELSQTITIRFTDTIGPIGTEEVLTVAQSGGVFYDEEFYDEVFYSALNDPIRRCVQHFDNNLEGRAISTVVEYQSSTDALELYSIKEEAKVLNRTFAGV
jgi:hypothetical protein